MVTLRWNRYSTSPNYLPESPKRSKSEEKLLIDKFLSKKQKRDRSRRKEKYLQLFSSSFRKSYPNAIHIKPDHEPIKLFLYCKEVISDIIKGLFRNYKLIPFEIRILWKWLYETLLSKQQSLGEPVKMSALEMVADLLFSNWLIAPLFIQPSIYGLLK